MPVDIDGLSFEELLELNERIVARLKVMESMQAHMEMMAFNLGARVSFQTRTGRQFGTLVKRNRKTVTVITEGGQRWNIPPHLLSAVKQADAEGAAPQPESHATRKRLK